MVGLFNILNIFNYYFLYGIVKLLVFWVNIDI